MRGTPHEEASTDRCVTQLSSVVSTKLRLSLVSSVAVLAIGLPIGFGGPTYKKAFTRQKGAITAPDNVQFQSRGCTIKLQTVVLHYRLPSSHFSSAHMSATVSSDRPELFLKHQDGTPVVFYLISRIPEDWAIWIRVCVHLR